MTTKKMMVVNAFVLALIAGVSLMRTNVQAARPGLEEPRHGAQDFSRFDPVLVQYMHNLAARIDPGFRSKREHLQVSCGCGCGCGCGYDCTFYALVLSAAELARDNAQADVNAAEEDLQDCQNGCLPPPAARIVEHIGLSTEYIFEGDF